jgi:hypothetical protein
MKIKDNQAHLYMVVRYQKIVIQKRVEGERQQIHDNENGCCKKIRG